MSPETHISHGKVLQVIGPVVDVSFEGELPEIYTALRVSNPSISDKAGNLVLEVAQHIGEHVVRTIAMDSTDGLVRGMAVENTGRGISVPVGKEVLGRIMNVIGEPVDEQGVVEAKERWEIHPRSVVRRASRIGRKLRNGYQSRRLARAVSKGR